MHAIYVPLKTDVKAALLSRAQRQDRDPRREAARIIRESLIRDGDLPIAVTDYHEVGRTAGVEPASAVPAT